MCEVQTGEPKPAVRSQRVAALGRVGEGTQRGNGNVLVIGLGAGYMEKLSLGTLTKAYTYIHFPVCI